MGQISIWEVLGQYIAENDPRISDITKRRKCDQVMRALRELGNRTAERLDELGKQRDEYMPANRLGEKTGRLYRKQRIRLR